MHDGFVLARAAGGEAEILTLAVAPAGARQGAGPRPVASRHRQGAARWAPRPCSWKWAPTIPRALALYAGLGFAKVGTRKGYYAAAGMRWCSGFRCPRNSPNLPASDKGACR